MSTKSLIAKVENGEIIGTTCNWDSYPEHMGRELTTHFNTESEIDQLLERGDIREIKDGKVEYYEAKDGNDDLTVWDLREELLEDAAADLIDYIYLWDGKRWIFASEDHNWTDVKAYLKANK